MSDEKFPNKNDERDQFLKRKIEEKKRLMEKPDTLQLHFVGRQKDPNKLATKEDLHHKKILQMLLEEMKAIDFYERTNLTPGKTLKKAHYVITAIEEILKTAKEKDWSLCVSDGYVYVFNGAYWKLISTSELKNFLGEAVEKLGIDKYDARYHRFKEELLNQFFSSGYLTAPDRKKDEVLINFLNGTFVISPEKRKLRPFQREDFLKYQLPFEYSDTSKYPLFRHFLNKVLPDEEQQKVLAEFIGYIFVSQKNLKLEKSLILYGGGANGKSVFFDVVSAMLGSENVSNYSLQSLTNETGYQRAKLSTVLLNYASEISPKMDSTLFKQLVSCEAIEARLPYGDPFILRDYAKLMFNTNELPRDVEQNIAFYRRFILIHFAITITENERDPQLANKIIHSELPGVFNWVLEGLERLLSQKKFTYSKAIEDNIVEYRKHSDSVQLFLDDCGYIKSYNKPITLAALYKEYKDYCHENVYKTCSNKTFSDRLRGLGFEFWRKGIGTMVYAEKKCFDDPSPNSLPTRSIIPDLY